MCQSLLSALTHWSGKSLGIWPLAKLYTIGGFWVLHSEVYNAEDFTGQTWNEF